MKKTLLLFLLPLFALAQSVTVNTASYTPEQLVSDVLISGACATVSNVTTQGNCGIGYFNNNGGSFPFAEGIVLRTGNAAVTAGPFSDGNISSVCSGLSDSQLLAVSNGAGQFGTVNDVTFLRFEITPLLNFISFNFLFSSNEYGTFQCGFGDVFAFLLTDLDTGITTNLAVIPGTNTPVSVTTIRTALANPSCSSVNDAYFGQMNALGDPIDMRGQTVPMTAFADVIPGHHYAMKLAIGDYNDNQYDSAVFIQGGSFAVSQQCLDNFLLTAFLDHNNNQLKDEGEPVFTNGAFMHQVNDTEPVTETFSSTGSVRLFPGSITDSYDFSYEINPEFAPYFASTASYNDVVAAAGSGTNSYLFPIVNTAPFTDVAVSILLQAAPRPGMAYTNKLFYTNNGVTNASGTLTFTCDHPYLTISTISESGPELTPIISDEDLSTIGFTFNYTDLAPGETRSIDVVMNVLPQPIVTLGQVLTNHANITANTDIIPSNNDAHMAQAVVSSLDPNNKLESHGGKITVSEFGSEDYLYYTINFQNLGIVPALKVRIDDVLDAKLDENTLVMLHASHSYVLQRIGNQLTWTFDPVTLPGVQQNAAASSGFVTFKIKPKAGYAAGDIILNQASIVFDDNEAITTNSVATEFTTELGTTNPGRTAIVLYPNPADGIVNIVSPTDMPSVQVFDLVGKKLKSETVSGRHVALDTAALANGIYLVIIDAGAQRSVTKLTIKR